jgi:hypothetical protein
MYMQKLRITTPILGMPNVTISDFWSWAYSDVLVNTNRSVFAEFLVGSALGVLDKPRIEWDGVDLHYGNKTIEVKCSAYLQSWKEDPSSIVIFDIGKKIAWHADSNTYEKEPIRSADCYVFCFFKEEKDKTKILDTTSWEFYVLATKRINEELRDQKSIGLKKLKSLCNPVSYGSLKAEIEHALNV